MTKVEEIRARLSNRDYMDRRLRADGKFEFTIALTLDELRGILAERDRLAAEVEAARDSLAAIADETSTEEPKP